MTDFIQTFQERKIELLTALSEHLQISLISLFFAVIIAVPLGILLTRKERMAEFIIGTSAVMQTVPSLALLGLLIPLVGIGKIPAVIALVVYALLPILRNTYTGIRELDESLIEAAKAMGMNSWRRLWKVELSCITNYYGRYSYGNGINCWNGYISSSYRCWWAW